MHASFQDLLRRLDSLSGQTREVRDGILQAIDNAERDPEMSLTRLRKVLEYLVRDVYERRIKEPAGTRPLENLLQRIVKDGHFPRLLAVYANAVRELGNVGTHVFHEQVTTNAVVQSLTQLMPIVEWYFENPPSQGSPAADRPLLGATPQTLAKDLAPLGPPFAPALTRRDTGPIAPDFPSVRRGPDVAQFVFVVANKHQLLEKRRSVLAYGDESRSWRPYHPRSEEMIGITAQTVASKQNLLHEVLLLDQGFIGKLRQAEQANTIVVILVDPWTVQLQEYSRFLSEYDCNDFLNCAVLVPWNEDDEETKEHWLALEDTIRGHFLRKSKDPKCFRTPLLSIKELRSHLRAALTLVRRRIIETGQARRAQGSHPISQPHVLHASTSPVVPILDTTATVRKVEGDGPWTLPSLNIERG